MKPGCDSMLEPFGAPAGRDARSRATSYAYPSEGARALSTPLCGNSGCPRREGLFPKEASHDS